MADKIHPLPTGTHAFLDQPEAQLTLRPSCDAIEIAAMFSSLPPQIPPETLRDFLLECQDAQTGHFLEPAPTEADTKPGELGLHQAMEGSLGYAFLSVGHALQLLEAQPRHAFHVLKLASPEALHSVLDQDLDWQGSGWGSGAWVDHFATALAWQHHWFEPVPDPQPLFDWLNQHANPETGLWSPPDAQQDWLLAVNGFYRLTRGSYAQWGRPLPYPEKTINSVLTHAWDTRHFGPHQGNACNVLDVIHPLWLCARQTSHRRAEAEAWARTQLPRALRSWQARRGFSFTLEPGHDARSQPGLQGTEMWLSIIYLLADYLGLSSALSFQPRGVHRLQALDKQEVQPHPQIHAQG
ncbi:MAG: hypothetical protein HC904_09005 [Blastochloris sp.]|nr:hypothetical protein [Blastochloris sp.]